MKFPEKIVLEKATRAWQGAWNGQGPEVIPVLEAGIKQKGWVQENAQPLGPDMR